MSFNLGFQEKIYSQPLMHVIPPCEGLSLKVYATIFEILSAYCGLLWCSNRSAGHSKCFSKNFVQGGLDGYYFFRKFQQKVKLCVKTLEKKELVVNCKIKINKSVFKVSLVSKISNLDKVPLILLCRIIFSRMPNKFEFGATFSIVFISQIGSGLYLI